MSGKQAASMAEVYGCFTWQHRPSGAISEGQPGEWFDTVGTPAFARSDSHIPGRVVAGFPGEQRHQRTCRRTGRSRAEPAEEDTESEIGVVECVGKAAGRPEHSAEVRIRAICSFLLASLDSIGAHDAGDHTWHKRRFHAI